MTSRMRPLSHGLSARALVQAPAKYDPLGIVHGQFTLARTLEREICETSSVELEASSNRDKALGDSSGDRSDSVRAVSAVSAVSVVHTGLTVAAEYVLEVFILGMLVTNRIIHVKAGRADVHFTEIMDAKKALTCSVLFCSVLFCSVLFSY